MIAARIANAEPLGGRWGHIRVNSHACEVTRRAAGGDRRPAASIHAREKGSNGCFHRVDRGAAPLGKLSKASLSRILARAGSMSAAEKAEALAWLNAQIQQHECQGAEIAAECLNIF